MIMANFGLKAKGFEILIAAFLNKCKWQGIASQNKISYMGLFPDT